MPLSMLTIFRFIEAEVRSSRSLEDSLERVISECEREVPHNHWDSLRRVDIEDSKVFARRLKQWFRNKALKAEINGLWFGIFNPSNGRWPIADFRVVGCSAFDADKNDNSWAANTQTWRPENRAFSPVLANYYRLAYRENGLGNDAEYPLCLAYTTLAIRDAIKASKPSVFLRNADSVGISIGFDSGDFIVLGVLAPDGLEIAR